tara:strand:+ start:363 stop:689 length:327 start_codon:yes stop_codon:yes gene_type:complete
MSGFDYYDHVNGLPESKLVLEMEKLHKRLFKTDVNSPVYQQLLNMIDMASQAYQDILYTQRIKKEDTVMDIGQTESVSYTPDYTKEDIVNAYIEVYTKKKPGEPPQRQ